MRKIIVDQFVTSIFSNLNVGIVVAKNVQNHFKNLKEYQELLIEATKQAHQYLLANEFVDNPIIKSWRNAYSQFKSKKGARCSIESLLKRVKNNNPLSNINPLVDIYNAVSLKFGVPVGGEDLSKIAGNILLTNAIGNEEFMAYGSNISEPPLANEIVYKDNFGVICRCLNWRESQRTILTENTTNAILFIELVDPAFIKNFNNALKELVLLIETHLDGCCKTYVLDKYQNEMTIDL